MSSAVQWLTSSSSKTRIRVYDVFGPDSTLRTDVLSEIERRTAADVRASLFAGEVSDGEIWQTLATVPLAGISSRIMIVSCADRIKSWDGLASFIKDKSAYTETTLVLLSDRAEAGIRVRDSSQQLPGKSLWKTSLLEWEQWIRDYSAGLAISCATPSLDLPPTGVRGARDASSSLAKWLSLRVEVTQQQAEYIWSRAGAQSSLARDVVEQLKLLGILSTRVLGASEFRAAVDAVLTPHGSEDFAELILFGRTQPALSSLAEREFSSLEWSRVLGYLSQRLDWLAPLHVALTTNEKLDQVQRRLGIHRKWILHYAHREDTTHNIAKHFDRARVARCRLLLADLDAFLSTVPGVPVGFGEVLLSSW